MAVADGTGQRGGIGQLGKLKAVHHDEVVADALHFGKAHAFFLPFETAGAEFSARPQL